MAASAFIESSILWSLVGAQSGYVGPQSQMEYLVNAEKCATRFLAFQQDGESDGKGGDNDFKNVEHNLILFKRMDDCFDRVVSKSKEILDTAQMSNKLLKVSL